MLDCRRNQLVILAKVGGTWSARQPSKWSWSRAFLKTPKKPVNLPSPNAPAHEIMTMSFDKLLGRIDKGTTWKSVRHAWSDTKMFFDFVRIGQSLFDTALGLLFTYKP